MSAGSSNQYVYGYQATLLTIGNGATTLQVIPPAHCLGHVLRYNSGGSLAIVNQAGMTAAQGYILGTTEQINADGPAQFFLAAGGATSIAQVIWRMSVGYSNLP